eukprot:CAMPEP_0195650614 /NCGR_PEP_ID=MMETSP0815-20121206/31816_1 /TAXON_ID=97485 /ORGANISM="Prymnesium parvum, Strain Texoma1" /LENGTH=93 /DNA_ID=CAMNT_0040794441 /DNA_START=169 /DNA_END=450 /DNA_ORIENTATION=-
MTALNSRSPNITFRHASGLFVASKRSSGVAAMAVRRFARKPLGGSFVIFTPFCNTDTGNLFDGIDVSHSLKDGSVLAGSVSSTSFSSVGIHDT